MFGRKKTAEHYILIYCNYSDAEQINREIALMSPNILGTLVDHAGELPSGSGYFHDVLSPKIDRMKKIHKDYKAAERAIKSLPVKQAWCCITWGVLLNRKPGEEKKVLRTVRQIAEFLNENKKALEVEKEITYDCYKKSRQRGIDRINAELGVFVA